MKKSSNIDWVKITAYGIILVLTIILATGSYRPKPQIIPVTIPKIIGSFKPQKPTIIHDVKYLKGNIIHTTDTLIIKEKDSVKLSEFASTFENDTIKIDINGLSHGEVEKISAKYFIKQRKVDVQVIPKETTFRLLGGLELGSTTQLNAFMAKANLLFQNRKGNVLSVGYDTDKRIWIGKTWSIFDVKR